MVRGRQDDAGRGARDLRAPDASRVPTSLADRSHRRDPEPARAARARAMVPDQTPHQKPAGGFLAIGPLYPGELLEDASAVRFRWRSDGAWIETVPVEHVDVNPEPHRPRRRWN